MFTRSDRLRPNTTSSRFLGTENDKSLIDDLYLTESCKHESKLVLRSAEIKPLFFRSVLLDISHPFRGSATGVDTGERRRRGCCLSGFFKNKISMCDVM